MKTTLFLGFGVFVVSGAPTRIQTLKKVHTWFFLMFAHFRSRDMPKSSSRSGESSAAVQLLREYHPFLHQSCRTAAELPLPELQRLERMRWHSEGTETRGVGEIFFSKSYFQQIASNTCFLELKYYVYHHMSPLTCWLNYSVRDYTTW